MVLKEAIKEGERRCFAQRGVKSAAVVKRLEVIENGEGGGVVGFKPAALWQGFVLERGKEALGQGVIVAVTLRAHALNETCAG